MKPSELHPLCVNTIRFLSVDMVEKASSGHPGLPMGAAPTAYVLWTRFLRHNPKNSRWWDRDRFVLSAGHGSALLYSLLHLTGYDLPLDPIKRFRQWKSVTPGHPESHVTDGVEASTGPLGQGVGNALGMAIGETHLAARYNRPGHELFQHFTYVLASDGDMMDGVQSEASSLAGHIEGPYGELTLGHDAARAAVILARGIGITPFRSILMGAARRRLRQRPFVSCSNRRREDAPFLDEVLALESGDPKDKLVATRTETAKSHRPGDGKAGMTDKALLSRHAKDAASPAYFMAGPPGMVTSLHTMLSGARADDDDIRTEEFTVYARSRRRSLWM